MLSIDDRLNAIIRELIGNGITLAQAVEAFEGKYIVAAMTASKGNVTQASRKLGVHRNTLHNKLRTQTMLNGFAESVRPVRRRISHKRVSAPAPVRARALARHADGQGEAALARSLATRSVPSFIRSIIELLRQRGNRLLGISEIHEAAR
jgi:transposase-like protein